MAKAVAHAPAPTSRPCAPGRATPALVENLRVEYYGAETPLQQIAGINVPEARLLVITPYDKRSLKAIEKAIQNSDLGINPSNDGTVIRLVDPAADRGAPQGVRQGGQGQGRGRRGSPCATCAGPPATSSTGSRRTATITSDELERAEKDLDKVTQDSVAEIDRLLQHKEQELLEV